MEGAPKPANDNEGWSMQDAIAEIGVIRQRIAATGAVDTEHDDLTRLIVDLQNQKIAPGEAVRKARLLEEARQNYH